MQALQDLLAGSRRKYAIAVATVVLLIAIAVSLATGLVGGSSQSTFDANGFVDAANQEGAGLVLGQPLISAQEGVEVYGISLDDASSNGASGADKAASGEAHGGASLTISPDSDAAQQVYSQCEGTGTFVCYRANNAALVFDQGADPHALARVDGAIRALASN